MVLLLNKKNIAEQLEKITQTILNCTKSLAAINQVLEKNLVNCNYCLNKLQISVQFNQKTEQVLEKSLNQNFKHAYQLVQVKTKNLYAPKINPIKIKICTDYHFSYTLSDRDIYKSLVKLLKQKHPDRAKQNFDSSYYSKLYENFKTWKGHYLN